MLARRLAARRVTVLTPPLGGMRKYPRPSEPTIAYASRISGRRHGRDPHPRCPAGRRSPGLRLAALRLRPDPARRAGGRLLLRHREGLPGGRAALRPVEAAAAAARQRLPADPDAQGLG